MYLRRYAPLISSARVSVTFGAELNGRLSSHNARTADRLAALPSCLKRSDGSARQSATQDASSEVPVLNQRSVVPRVPECFIEVLNRKELSVSKVRNVASLALAVFAVAAFMASPASGETLRFNENPGQPVASGNLEGEEAHGVIHCQPIAELFLGETPHGGAPGVVVINPNGSYLGAPRGGTCETIYQVFGG